MKKGSAKERAARRKAEKQRARDKALAAYRAEAGAVYLCSGEECITPGRRLRTWNNHLCDICQKCFDGGMHGWNEMGDDERRKFRAELEAQNMHLPYLRPKWEVDKEARAEFFAENIAPPPPAKARRGGGKGLMEFFADSVFGDMFEEEARARTPKIPEAVPVATAEAEVSPPPAGNLSAA